MISSKVAEKLIQSGVLPQSYVPMCFEKSKWATVAMLSIMKAGAAFVPLDPTQPVKRLQEIAQEVGSKFVVTSARSAEMFAPDSHLTTVIVDDQHVDSMIVELYPTQIPVISPDQPALIMFTVRWSSPR